VYCCCDVYLYISEEATQKAGDVRVKLELLSLTAITASPSLAWQQDACLQEGARARFSIHPEQGHEGRTRKVPQEDQCSSMYIGIMHCWPVTVNIRASATVHMLPFNNQQFPSLCMCKSITVTLTDVYFSQVQNKP
jgi:hypothetical protein